MTFWRWLLSVLLALGLANPSSAQEVPVADDGDTSEPARARKLFETGVAEAAAQHWVEAERAFQLSSDLVPRSSALYNLARVRFELGRELPCLEALDRFAAAPDRDEHSPYLGYATELKQRVVAQRAYVRIELTPAQATLHVDNAADTQSGTPRRLLVTAGSHSIEVRAQGYGAEHWTFDAQPGVSVERAFALTPLPTPPTAAQVAQVSDTPPTQPQPSMPATPGSTKATPAAAQNALVLPWIAIGTGALLALAGAVTAGLAKLADDDFVQQCPGATNCDPALRPLQRRAASLATATDVLLIGGVALAAGGGTALWIAGSRSADRVSATLSVRHAF